MRAMEPLAVRLTESRAPVISHHALERPSGGQWSGQWEWAGEAGLAPR